VRLEGVLAQERARLQLEGELAAGRLAHAYLFVGPQGVGRTTCARALFAAANCQNPGETACGACGPCRRLAAGSHEDFLVVEPPSDSPSAQIKVEQVRQVIRTLSFAPFGGGWRMVVIREAGRLNPASSGALLKTLEEPPPNNILVLTVQDPREVLPTLVSRCRRVNFSPLDPELIMEELVRRGMDPGDARLKAAMSGGSLGRALELDPARLRRELGRLQEHLARPGGALEDWELAEALVADHRGATIDRQGLAQTLELWAQYFRDQAACAAGRPTAALLESSPPTPQHLPRLVEAFNQVRRAQNLILANAAPELCLTVLLSELRRRLRQP